MPLPLMPNLRYRIWFARGLLCALAGFALTAAAQSDSMDSFGGNPDSSRFILIPRDAPDWTRHFRIGAIVGMNISADFKTKGTFNISGNQAGAGVYDDGYVHPDESGDTVYTGYWGYNNASQLVGNTLSLHGASTYSSTSSSSENGGAFPGFEMAYGDNIWYWKHARVGWELGFSLLPINITDTSPMAATVNQTTDKFNTGGIIVPGAPYQGGSSGQGPLIPITPMSTTNTASAGTVTGSRTLDVMLYTIRLGPAFYWDLNSYLGIQLGAGPAVGIVSGSYKYNEIVTVTSTSISVRNRGSFDFTDLTYGGYVNGTLLYHIINDADLYVGAQYMPMGNASFSSGGRSGQLNLGGQLYISAGINWPF